MKVYIVTSGCYSDYSIDYVFADKSMADKFISELDEDDDYAVNVFDVLESAPDLYTYWQFIVEGKERGSGITIKKHTTDDKEEAENYSSYTGSRYSAGWGRTDISEKRAQKLAAEMYQRYIREAADPTSENYEAINDTTPTVSMCTQQLPSQYEPIIVQNEMISYSAENGWEPGGDGDG